MKNNPYILILTLFIITLFSCTTKNKIVPNGYFRIDLPEKKYKTHNFKNCNFSTEIPEYLTISIHSQNSCWITLSNNPNNINIHLSYHKINNNLDSLLKDSHNLVYEGHYRKADGIWETPGSNLNSMIYELYGEVATPIQFYVTDKKNHFLRGSMYPSTINKMIRINRDSLNPIINFYKKDIEKIIESIHWKP
tara:strand:+ start:95 stop:673 length:579 start_codon:yes stop_codon:yes gene_type:complete